jgi:hypothetical protein
MLKPSSFAFQSRPLTNALFFGMEPSEALVSKSIDRDGLADSVTDGTDVEWCDEEIVHLHWRLLKEVNDLSDPDTPLEEKLDTLRWIFTEHEKDHLPFSFVNCLKVVGCSPQSPIAYIGMVDPGEVRESIRFQVADWLISTLRRYPSWVRDAVQRNPEWVERQLARNPQWINEQVKRRSVYGDLFSITTQENP